MVFKARFPGRCRVCEKGIGVDQEILRLGPKNHIHVECASPDQIREDAVRDMEFRQRKAQERREFHGDEIP